MVTKACCDPTPKAPPLADMHPPPHVLRDASRAKRLKNQEPKCHTKSSQILSSPPAATLPLHYLTLPNLAK
eukprot:1181418-Prorocentrum_minimum.AAC.1